MCANDLIRYNIIICAVVFGGDDSFLKINLNNDFSFKKISLFDKKYFMNSPEITLMSLIREYGEAQIEEDMYDVISLVSESTIEIKEMEVEEKFIEIGTTALSYVDNIIRSIRFYIEAPIHIRKVVVRMYVSEQNINRLIIEECRNEIPINEIMSVSKNISISSNDIEILNRNIPLECSLLRENKLKMCYQLYDLSYFSRRFESISYLITSLEGIFLYNDEKDKHEKMAKRCAVYIFNAESERMDCYKHLYRCYKTRCDIVHEIKYKNIDDKDIIFLRSCVRKSLIKYINDNKSKNEIIEHLKKDIGELNYFNKRKTTQDKEETKTYYKS